MAEKSTALWLIILTIITCAAVPVFLILLTSPPASQFIFISGENFLSNYYNDIAIFEFTAT